jgi:phosphatidate phosphatase APP1
MIRDEKGKHPKSDLNGIINGFIKLDHNRAQSLVNAQNERNGWLTIRAVSEEHSGSGRIRLLGEKGVSVISDIDDTIKITEIPKGGKVVVKNTFFKEFTAAPKMEDLYQSFYNASFHYVSGAPWQLYRPLASFLKGIYPEGTYHMKNVPTNLLSPTTWKDLLKLTGDATIEQKLVQITEIIERFPNRQFILVGDSGEHDPEVYRQLRSSFPKQVRDIWIRDVVKAQDFAPERLTGMNIIAA